MILEEETEYCVSRLRKTVQVLRHLVRSSIKPYQSRMDLHEKTLVSSLIIQKLKATRKLEIQWELTIDFRRKYALYVMPLQHLCGRGDATGVSSYDCIGIFLGGIIFRFFRADNDIILLCRPI